MSPLTLSKWLLVAALGLLMTSASFAQDGETIYVNGDILTMNDAQPTAEAVAVLDGRILAVGDREAVEDAHKGDGTDVVDLDGRTLMPGFIDSHSHLVLTALKQATVNMDPPPAGGRRKRRRSGSETHVPQTGRPGGSSSVGTNQVDQDGSQEPAVLPDRRLRQPDPS